MARAKEVYRLITDGINPMPSYANNNRRWEHTIYATKELAYRGLERLANELANKGYEIEEVRLGLPAIRVYFEDSSERPYMTVRIIAAIYEY